MSVLHDFINDVSQANDKFIESLRTKYPDQVAKAIEIYGDGPSGWKHPICGEARGLWEHQDPRYSSNEEFQAFLRGDFEKSLQHLEREGMPPELIIAIFELGEIHTQIGYRHGHYEGYGPLRRERG